MSDRAEPQDHELKPHGDELEGALKPTVAAAKKKEQSAAESGTETKE